MHYKEEATILLLNTLTQHSYYYRLWCSPKHLAGNYLDKQTAQPEAHHMIEARSLAGVQRLPHPPHNKLERGPFCDFFL